ncbi:uncharacterized protein MELLADRAFT_108641 [Melampsora larici-populina 98AG31]|uniref:Uncharacterized protein n=1 Tax=Melampsora larici-populina (strain 98AG31 / pathotype 3-4-7) TaxID=747676 RepID=F4RTS2_MELLP|nr:uncharacterized protein MELLADRAFT_108641 [Melampsora larici-populina 98AG31]EGG04053.1 hypothetical protein MELLADRAFT_108641 [Melampsora larici-populina 98AG31]
MIQQLMIGNDITKAIKLGRGCLTYCGPSTFGLDLKHPPLQYHHQGLYFHQHRKRHLHQSYRISTPTTPIPRWLKSLESNQNRTKDELNKLATNQKEAKLKEKFNKDLRNEIVIYESKVDGLDSNRSPNRVGFKLVSLIVISTYVAQQIRHNGAFPIWLDSNSQWSEYQLQLLDSKIRFLISTSILSFTTYKSLRYFLTLSQLSDFCQKKYDKKDFDSNNKFDKIFKSNQIDPQNTYKNELNSILSGRSLVGIKPIKSSLPFYLPSDGNWGSLDPLIDGNSIQSSFLYKIPNFTA